MSDSTLTWNCQNCGAKNLQGDVCPFCGKINDNPKPRREMFKGTSRPAAPNYDTSYREFTSIATAAPVTKDSTVDWLASVASVPMIVPQEGPVTSDDFFASDKKPFIFNKGNRARVEGYSRGIARSWSVYLWSFLGFLGLLAFTLATLPDFQLVTNLETRGKETVGTITNKHYSSSSKSTTYYMTYAYVVSGKTYQVEQRISKDIYSVNNLGGKVTARYLPENPAQARLGGEDKDDDSIKIGFYILIVAWTGFAVGCVFALNHILRNLKLTAQGQLVPGRVVGAHISRSKSTYTLHLTYAFKSPTTGRTIQRKESAVRNDLRQASAPAYGLPVRVLYVDDQTYRVM